MLGRLLNADGDFVVEIFLSEREIYMLFEKKIRADILDEEGCRLGSLIIANKDDLEKKTAHG